MYQPEPCQHSSIYNRAFSSNWHMAGAPKISGAAGISVRPTRPLVLNVTKEVSPWAKKGFLGPCPGAGCAPAHGQFDHLSPFQLGQSSLNETACL